MKKRHIKLMSLLIALCLLLTACASSGNGDGTMKAGTYEEEIDGYGGPMKVVVTVDEEGKISEIDIPEHNETEGIGSNAIDKLPGEIVDTQSLGVEAVSGATATSTAILKAVEKAVEKAGGDVEAMKTATAEKTDGEPLEEETEVLVIGGGGAGLASAVSAAQQGAKVILIEKADALGGNTVRAGGPYNAVDPERQKNVPPADEEAMASVLALTEKEAKSERHQELMDELKKELDEYNKGPKDHLFDVTALHKLQTYDGGDYVGRLPLIEILVDNSLPTLEWMGENGVDWSGEISTVAGGLWPRAHRSTESAGHSYIRAHEEKAKELGVDIYTNAEAKELLMEDGKVVGAKGTYNDGPMEIKSDVVILATGGFAGNKEMRQKYNPDLVDTLPTTNAPSVTGDGIKMAEAINANTIGMEYIQSLPLGSPENGQLNEWIGGGGVEYYYQVNKEGKRFMAEDGRRDEMTEALLAQPDQQSFVIADSDNIDFRGEEGKNIWGDDIEKLVEDGKIYRADTIEELAEQIKVDPKVLKETHENFNKYAEAGSDAEFGRKLFGKPLTKAPFYASPRVPTVHHTMGGVEIDTTTHVMDKDGNNIPGLLAAGEVTGGIHGSNRLGGNALVDIHVFGKIAGEEAAKMLKN